MTNQTTVARTPGEAVAGGPNYRYERFTTRLMLADLRFSRRAPQPGQLFPSFDLATPGEGRQRSANFVGVRPFVLVLGSLTCPMTASAAAGLRELHESFGDSLPFVSVYTREAHPGDRIPQPQLLDEKIAHARELATRDDYRWHVAVDDIDGTLHRQLDAKPNAVFIVDANGRLAFRSIWSSDLGSIRAAIRAVISGEQPKKQRSTAMMGPMLRALPWIDRVVSGAGRTASRDLWLAAPPMALMAKLARPLRPAGRNAPKAS